MCHNLIFQIDVFKCDKAPKINFIWSLVHFSCVHIMVITSVQIELPTVEVRFENLMLEAKCHLGQRDLPSLWNVIKNCAEVVFLFNFCKHFGKAVLASSVLQMLFD